ncbi:hypothetical protein MUO79_04830 [Candidatus Bathyarchaeota archaeon]|nr:hypothetical protein [Candidatus Bathyarchaeota archaeon]
MSNQDTNFTISSITLSNGPVAEQIPPQLSYNVTFTESGLPVGTEWWVNQGSDNQSSASNVISFSLPNGTYTYTTGASGYTARACVRFLSRTPKMELNGRHRPQRCSRLDRHSLCMHLFRQSSFGSIVPHLHVGLSHTRESWLSGGCFCFVLTREVAHDAEEKTRRQPCR